MCVVSSAVMGAISIVTALASTAVSVYSSVQQGKAQKAQYEYQAEIDKQNAKIADDNAKQLKQEGIEESRLQRLKTQQKIASQTSAMAANGIGEQNNENCEQNNGIGEQNNENCEQNNGIGEQNNENCEQNDTEQKDFYIDFSKNKEVEKKYNELLFFMKKKINRCT